jgi:hypothetical protein
MIEEREEREIESDDRETSKAVGERERESSFVGTRIRAAGASVHAFATRSTARQTSNPLIMGVLAN